MKTLKILSIVSLLLAFTFCFISCDETDTPKEEKSIILTNADTEDIYEDWETEEEAEDEPSKPASSLAKEKTTIEEQVILDYEGVKITAKEYVTDSFWGDGIKLLVENNSDKDLNVSADALIVNDFMIYDLFYCEVSAGKKSNETLYLSSSELENAGITNVGKIEIDFYASESDTYDRIFEHKMAIITTSDYDNMDTSVDIDAVEFYNENGFKISGKAVEEDDFWGSAIVLYIENNTDTNVGVSCEDMSINGFMISPLLSSEIYANKKAIDEITIFESDLEENDIESIEDIELSFRIYNSDTYRTITETGNISFSVK